MGTYASLTVPAAEERALAAGAVLAQADLREIDGRLSIFRPDSEISRLNLSAGASPSLVSAQTEEVLRLSLRYADATGGAFDPTVGPLVRFWGFNKGAPCPLLRTRP